MNRRRAEQAAAAYSRLCAFGAYVAERQELSAAAVTAATIDALYPSSFASLVPDLITHLNKIPAEVLLQRPTGKYRKVRSEAVQLTGDLYKASQADMGALIENQNENRVLSLWSYLSGRDATAHASTRVETIGIDLATSIWAAHWNMQHRFLLPPQKQAATDELMVILDKIMQLQ